MEGFDLHFSPLWGRKIMEWPPSRPAASNMPLAYCIEWFEPDGEKRKTPLPFGNGVNGAGDEARTRYLHLGKVALYRMSYTRNGHVVL